MSASAVDLFDDCGSQKLSPSRVKLIKQMLISGDKSRIMEAVEQIQSLTLEVDTLLTLISAEIAEFLCDAMTPFDEVASRGIHNCLERMIDHGEFFLQGHSCYVVESLIRSIHFLNKSLTTSSTLNESIHLLMMITQGYNTFEVVPECKTLNSLLQMFPALLQSTVTTIKNKHQIGWIILNVTDMSMDSWDFESFISLLDSISIWMDAVNEFFHSDHSMRENLICLCCFLAESALKLIASKGIPSQEDENLCDLTDRPSDLTGKIVGFLTDTGAPYLSGLPLSTIEIDPRKAESFLRALLYLYGGDVPSDRVYMTHGLCEAEFLQFVTKVISFADFGKGHELRQLGVLTLSHAILSLAEDGLQVDRIWPKGLDDFRSEIRQGFSQLPLDASLWLDVLTDPHSPGFAKIALLLYLYFYCMTAKCQGILETIYPSIVTFLNTSPGIESSVLLVKITWFVYVMSQLSCTDLPDGDPEAKSRMVAILEAQSDLSLVYTHHPALLYWSFSSDISNNVQLKTVQLWLLNKSPDCKELEDLIRKSSDVRFAMLDTLQNECGQVVDSAFSTLRSVMTESEDEVLASNIWFLLPQMLAKFTTDSASAKNVDYVIELCSMKMPKNVDIVRIIRVASLLPEVLVKSDLISVVPSYALTLSLLQAGFHADDARVMQVFLRSGDFVRKITSDIGSNVADIAIVCLKIVTILWRNGNKCAGRGTPKKIQLSRETLAEILEGDCGDVVAASLNFLQEILSTDFESAIFEIPAVDANLVEILLFDVQNICMKDIPQTLLSCWRCLRSFLLLETSFALNLELMADPLFHEVIAFHLPQLKDSQDMRDFLMTWLDENEKAWTRCRHFQGKIIGGYFAETCHRIARFLAGNLGEDNRQLYEKVLRCGHLLGM